MKTQMHYFDNWIAVVQHEKLNNIVTENAWAARKQGITNILRMGKDIQIKTLDGQYTFTLQTRDEAQEIFLSILKYIDKE